MVVLIATWLWIITSSRDWKKASIRRPALNNRASCNVFTGGFNAHLDEHFRHEQDNPHSSPWRYSLCSSLVTFEASICRHHDNYSIHEALWVVKQQPHRSWQAGRVNHWHHEQPWLKGDETCLHWTGGTHWRLMVNSNRDVLPFIAGESDKKQAFLAKHSSLIFDIVVKNGTNTKVFAPSSFPILTYLFAAKLVLQLFKNPQVPQATWPCFDHGPHRTWLQAGMSPLTTWWCNPGLREAFVDASLRSRVPDLAALASGACARRHLHRLLGHFLRLGCQKTSLQKNQKKCLAVLGVHLNMFKTSRLHDYMC